jgi:hypothetical protein
MKSMFKLKTSDSNTILNHYLFIKFKLIKRGKFNHLTNTLTQINDLSFILMLWPFVQIGCTLTASFKEHGFDPISVIEMLK